MRRPTPAIARKVRRRKPRWYENLLLERECGFESRRPHHLLAHTIDPKIDVMGTRADAQCGPNGTNSAPRSRFRRTSEAPGGQGERSRRYRSCYPEAKRVEPDIGIALEADGRTDELALVAPGTAADNAEVRIAALEPR